MSDIISICPGCGLKIPAEEDKLDGRYNASLACRQLYSELSYYTLSLQDTEFIHQLIVDTYAAQHSGKSMRPITTAFALIGLYLTFERGFTGRQVQKAHMLLAQKTKNWPHFNPPRAKASLTVLDVIYTSPGQARNEMIGKWGKSVWDVWEPEQKKIKGLAEAYLSI
ncbi:MAG TPA: DUF5946 family protein [Anaerolineae bacterium]|nr:DUF5946 family protein [Anaerolineae bacterium]